MRVFITGGTGYVGSAVVERLVADGHAVAALARSDEAARALAAAGATPVPGSLSRTDVLRAAAAEADAVVHAAVDYAMTDEADARELAAVAALLEGARVGGTRARRAGGTPVVYTSTALVYGLGPDLDTREDAPLPEVSAQPVKAAAERLVLGADGITGVVLRPGLVHGRGGSGLVTGLVGAAAATGAATYVGAGANAWSAVHVDDLAALYARVLARPAGGVFNVAADHDTFTFRELAEAIAALTGSPAVSVPPAAAQQQLGPLAHVLASTSVLSADRARATFGWSPARASLLDDVRAGSYRVPVGSPR